MPMYACPYIFKHSKRCLLQDYFETGTVCDASLLCRTIFFKCISYIKNFFSLAFILFIRKFRRCFFSCMGRTIRCYHIVWYSDSVFFFCRILGFHSKMISWNFIARFCYCNVYLEIICIWLFFAFSIVPQCTYHIFFFSLREQSQWV